jgi:diaminohydroxyphosphoribosylaminopyrimidine deaminase/5-amino-6-(5-phosphoribosylamino)uracil reductase
LVHKWRAEEDAILVGKNTAKHDNPMLTTREWEGKNPVRVVIDRRLELSNNLHLFDKSVMTICINDIKDENQEHLAYLKVDFDQNFAQNLMDVLNQYHIQSVIVEGGATTLHYFIQNELWDEARVFISPTIFGKGIKAPQITGVLHSETNIDTDQLFIYTKL